jgi:hypothetical protein
MFTLQVLKRQINIVLEQLISVMKSIYVCLFF